MVRVVEAKREEFFYLAAQKKVYCFGAGKRLEYFRKNHPYISIAGIIDNYKKNNVYDMDGKWIPVWFPDEAIHQIDLDMVIVVTSVSVEEIVEQMDRIIEFDGVSCYLEILLDSCIGLAADEALQLKRVASGLLRRNRESIIKKDYGETNLSSVRKKFQTWEYFRVSNTAGSKAREDIKTIFGNMGYQVLKLHCSRGDVGTVAAQCSDRLARSEWMYIYDMIPKHSIMMMQSMSFDENRLPKDIILRMKKEKQISFVYLIHDVDLLRKYVTSQKWKEEFPFIKEFSDFFIVHNTVMRQYFKELGIEENRIINLEIFDYLHCVENTRKIFEKSITIAGNLNLEKSPYLKFLKQLSPLKIHLYGPNFSHDMLSRSGYIDYGGSISADLLPQKLDRGFGLVWDGNSIDTCVGGTGEYLRYNNPHKMSLYLSAGLPVIIWRGAAQAGFVRENRVGIAVDSLYEIYDILNSINEEEYTTLAENAKKISRRLKDGHYTKLAVKRVEELAEKI